MAEKRNQTSESNENQERKNNPGRDQQNTGNKQNKGKKGDSSMDTDENSRTKGYGSSQREERSNVGPMDAEFDELPSKSRNSGNNQTGPGLG